MTQHLSTDGTTDRTSDRPTDRTSGAGPDHVHRRTALRTGAATLAATAAAVVAGSSGAQAAAGQAVVQGGNNVVGTATTYLTSSGATPTLQVRNTGPGASAFFFSQNSNGFGAGTGAGNRFGLSSSNSGAAGKGAALGAGGGNNVGLLANTANADRYAVTATNLAPADGSGGGVLGDGGQGAGVVALTANQQVPLALVVGGATAHFGDTFLAAGAVARTETDVPTTWLYGVVSAQRPALTLAGVATLAGGGAVTITLPAEVVRAADTTDASVVVTARSGSMPNLFASVSTAGVVTISGGVAYGTVSYQVTLHQPLVQQMSQSTTSGAGEDVLVRARGVVDAAGRG